MKKLLASAFLLTGLSVLAAEDDYILYWQVVQNDVDDAAYAAVRMNDGSGNKSSLNIAGAESGVSMVELTDGVSSPIGSVIGSSGINPTAYSFFVELYSAEGDSLWTSSYFAYSALMDYISKPAGSTGGASVPSGGVWQVSATAVPEPSSGLLMLLGLAGLALRRKRKHMKKLMMGLVAAASLSGFAAIDDQLIVFSTKGPDLYQDGTTVVDGECYALCWSKDGVFEGVAANGAAVDPADQVVLLAPVAKGGCCPTVMFQVAAEKADALAGGEYCVLLLDTRVTSASGAVTVGRKNLVNASGAVGTTVAATAGIAAAPANAESVTGSVVAAVAAAAPAGVAQPVVTGIRIEDGYAYISVRSADGQALPATLSVSGAESLEKGFTGTAANAADEKGATEAILVRPASGASGFFKVQGL